MSKLVTRPRGGAYKKGQDFPSAKRKPRQVRYASHNDPALLGQAVPSVPPPPPREIIQVLTRQRDAALKALSNRENVDLLLDRFDRTIDRVEKKLQRLQRILEAALPQEGE